MDMAIPNDTPLLCPALSNEKRKVLFLCTGNTVRSQMAEAIVNARLGDEWQAFSAGTKPGRQVHPFAVRVLREMGIEHQGRPKSALEFRDVAFDLVVTLCDDAAENCPVWLGEGKRVHLGLPDPAEATGTEDEILDAFRAVRDQITREVPDLLRRWQQKITETRRFHRCPSRQHLHPLRALESPNGCRCSTVF
jgi:arsenate reductase